MPAAAIAVPALISGGTAIAGGIMGSRAANKAAKTQSDAAAEVARIARDASGRASERVINTSEQAATGVSDAANAAAGSVEGAANNAATGVENAAAGAVGRVDNATNAANTTLGDVYSTIRQAINPYQEAGARAVAGLEAGANEKFQFSEDDPSYQWRLEQGQKALERSAAARGGLQGGGTLKALTRYAQGAASTEYQAAFDRFQADKQTRLSTLGALAGFGQNANSQLVTAGTNYGDGVSRNTMTGGMYGADAMQNAAKTAGTFRVGGAESAGGFRVGGADAAGRFRVGGANNAGVFEMDGARIAGDAITGGANARAAGTVGSANAWTGAIKGVGEAGVSAWDRWKSNKE